MPNMQLPTYIAEPWRPEVVARRSAATATGWRCRPASVCSPPHPVAPPPRAAPRLCLPCRAALCALPGVQAKLKSPLQLQELLDITRQLVNQLERDDTRPDLATVSVATAAAGGAPGACVCVGPPGPPTTTTTTTTTL